LSAPTIDDELLAASSSIPEPEAPPRRGPGRPRKDGSAPGSARASAPKRPPSARRVSGAQLRSNIAMVVGGLNLALSLSRSFAADALTDSEADLLTDALYAEAQASTRIMKWVERAAVVTPHFLLLRAAFEILMPRLQRRGLIPGGTLPEHTPEQCAGARSQGFACPMHTEPANVTPMYRE